MLSVGAVEAEKSFNSLLDIVEKGESVQITRDGRVVAVINHVKPPRDREDAMRVLEEMRELRKGLSLDGLSIRDLINEGRR